MVTKTEKKTKHLRRVGFFDRTLLTNYGAVLGIIGTIVTLISFFVTANDISFNVSCLGKLYIITIKESFLGLLFILGIMGIYIYMWRSANNTNHANLKINNTTVNVIVGDIWELLKKEPMDRSGEISVVGVNDFYDVIVDDRIIAASSLHGQYIKQLISAGKLDELNNTIEMDTILNRQGNYETVEARSIGKKRRYKVGSVVEYESYVLAAFTKFDDHNKAWLSAEEYTGFWMRFWKNIDEIYAGRTINIPLMGAGITRFRDGKPTKQELLEAMLWSMKMSGFQNTYADKQVNFVIYQADVPEIDFYHIQHNPNFR